jgi:hypothetical protein
VRRARRTFFQRLVSDGMWVAGYRCVDERCDWNGLLDRRMTPETSSGESSPPVRFARGAAPWALAALAILAAVAAARWVAPAHSAEANDTLIGGRVFARGESFEGQPLPDDHPLRKTAAGASHADTFNLRRFCAWGRVEPVAFQGTVEEALRAARVPTVAAEHLLTRLASGLPHDRLTIANDALRIVGSPRSFEPDGLTMLSGRTLCLGSRVNFEPGLTLAVHLYESFDDRGRGYALLISDQKRPIALVHARDRPSRRSPQGPAAVAIADPLDPGEASQAGDDVHIALAKAAPDARPNEVPAPGTLALTLLGLAAAVAAPASRRWRNREGAEQATASAGRARR